MGFDNDCIINIQSVAGEYFCPLCNRLVYPNEALQAPCTHLYCKPCLTDAVSTIHTCFHDEFRVTEADCKPLLESNKALADTIGTILVHCLYYRTGCTWRGPLSDCISHCPTCSFGESSILCNKCGVQVVHRQVQEHAQSCPGVQSQVVSGCLYQQGAQQYLQQHLQGHPPQAYQFQTQVSAQSQNLSQPQQILACHDARNLHLRDLLVSTARDNFKSIKEDLKNRLDARNKLVLDITLMDIGDTVFYHHYIVSLKWEKLRKMHIKMAAMKIRKKYRILHTKRALKLFKKQQRCALQLTKKVERLSAPILSCAFPYLAQFTVTRNDDELETRHIGDYVLGKLLIRNLVWRGNMRLLPVAIIGENRANEVTEQAAEDGLLHRINFDRGNDDESGSSEDDGLENLDFHFDG